jgi:hypothetical protein
MLNRYRPVAFFALALAAATGMLLRFGLVLGMPAWAQNYTAIRHAHSHLMYFGWVTVALMALIWHFLPTITGRPLSRGVGLQMAASALLALLSFPAFWVNGYGLTQIGSAELPLGSMAAGLNGLLWLLFVALYVRATWGLAERSLAVQLWDWAVVLLLFAFRGALGLVASIALGLTNPLVQQLSLHLFLDLFGVGWFNLALLGILWALLGKEATKRQWLPTQSLALLLAPTFILGVSPALVTADMFWLATLANIGAALLLGRHLCALWRQRLQLPLLARFGLLILAVHLLTAVAILWPGFWQWSAGTQLRLFFLHDFLLGWVSSTLLGVLLKVGSRQPRVGEHYLAFAWMGGVAAMLLALLGVGFLQFNPVPAVTWFWLAAWSSVPLSVVALWACTIELRRT